MTKKKTEPKESKLREIVPEETSVEGGTAARKTPMGIEPEPSTEKE